MVIRAYRRSRWLALCLVLAAPASAQEPALDPASPLTPLPDLGVDWPSLDAPAAPAADPASGPDIVVEGEQRYRAAVDGIDDIAGLRAAFDALSALVAGDGKPANRAQIDRRAADDERLLADLLRSRGYYDAAVSTATASEAGRLVVRLTAEPGPLFRFAGITLTGLEAAGAEAAPLRAAFAVRPDDPVDAERVATAEAALKAALGRQGFPFAKVGAPDIVVDHETRTATLALAVETGGAARFGRIVPQGQRPLFGARHLGRIARFAPGDPYDAALIDDFRRALIATGLVSSATITPTPAGPGVVDVAVRLERAPSRTIAGELGYGTGEGFRAAVSWQHRNLIKPEGAVTFRGVAGTREQLIGATLRRNNYKARDRVLTAQAIASNSMLNAYDAKSLRLGIGLERQTNIIWQKKWTWSLGAELFASDERDTIRATAQRRRRTFLVVAAPTSLAYDGSDDLLNPTSGYRLAGRVSPEASLRQGTRFYARIQLDGSAYIPIAGNISIAGRMRLGSIPGADRDDIAPSRRFYAGGGGSVRGYGYQRIGPRDIANDPIGGRSLAEVGLEARIRFGDFGVVPFVDAGNLYTTTLPRFTGLRYGAGIGARYYTSFGPIRVDVGTPLNRRPGDGRIAVYVSLGQAF